MGRAEAFKAGMGEQKSGSKEHEADWQGNQGGGRSQGGQKVAVRTGKYKDYTQSRQDHDSISKISQI